LDNQEKKRKECEKRVQDYGERNQHKEDEISKGKISNSKEQIEVLYEKINYLSNMLALSEEKKFRFEHMIKMQSQSKKWDLLIIMKVIKTKNLS